MKRGKDFSAKFPGLFLVHHNLPGSTASSHAHAEHHLIIPLQGEITVKLRDKSLTCGPGRMVYISPDTEHAFDSSPEKGERLICMFEPVAWKKAEGKSFDSCMVVSSQLCKELLFYLLLNENTVNASAIVDVMIRTLCEILGSSTRLEPALIDHIESSVQKQELKKAIAIAKERGTESLSVAELAKLSGQSVRNLSRLFQVELGLSPKQLLTSIKIEKAKEMLLSGNVTVTETAYAVGYNSLSQFISSFRDLTGQNPSDFATSRGFGRKPQ